MANPSPLLPRHERADAQLMGFGDDVAIVAMHDVVETEYGRVRNGAAVMDAGHRGLVEVTGGERADFLHRMLSNEVHNLPTGRANRHFLLTAKGRIMADLMLLAGEDRLWLDTAVHDVEPLMAELDKLLFGEDVQLRDRTADAHRLSLHGPEALERLDALSASSVEPLEPGEQRVLKLAGAEVIVYRHDQLGVPGLHLWVVTDQAEAVWEGLVGPDPEQPRTKPLGWMAYNIARLEAGTPHFHVDFGPDTLPAETGLLDVACSHTKGCYRGQEVVARMRDLGHPAKRLVGFVCQSEALPVDGTSIFAEPDAEATPIGAVTSAAPSPLLGNTPIGLAMVKWDYHEPGTTLHTPAEGRTVAIEVRELAPIAPLTA